MLTLALSKGYIRSSRLFLLAGRPESALWMAEMAAERIPQDEVDRVERLVLMRAEIQTALDAEKRRIQKNACHILKVPFEVLSEIMLCAVASKQCELLRT
jgi:hypothetical protein